MVSKQLELLNVIESTSISVLPSDVIDMIVDYVYPLRVILVYNQTSYSVQYKHDGSWHHLPATMVHAIVCTFPDTIEFGCGTKRSIREDTKRFVILYGRKARKIETETQYI